jgi:hypothetical protein
MRKGRYCDNEENWVECENVIINKNLIKIQLILSNNWQNITIIFFKYRKKGHIEIGWCLMHMAFNKKGMKIRSNNKILF